MKISFGGVECAIYDVYGPKITTRKLRGVKKNILTTNWAVYIVALDGIVLSKNLDNAFEF